MLPRRYDAAGLVPHHGLFANGLWHPTLHCAGPLDWSVKLHLPPGTTGALNGEVGDTLLHWSGPADHLALAVIPGGSATVLQTGMGNLVYLSRRPLPDRHRARLQASLAQPWPADHPPQLTIVETPSRRRLARVGPSTLFLSDRALRLSAGLWRYHAPALREGVLAAALPVADPYDRAVAAAILARGDDKDARQLLGWARFLPQIDAILYDGTLPFYSEVFAEPWPSDPLQDDPAELAQPRLPPQALLRFVAARGGPTAPDRLAQQLLAGLPLDEALKIEQIGSLPTNRPPVEEATVTVERDGDRRLVRLRRSGPADLPALPIPWTLDGQPQVWEAPAGPAELLVELPDRPDKIVFDPDGALHDPDRADNIWPRPWSITGAAYPYTLSLRSGRIAGAADLIFRRPYNSPTAVSAGLFTDDEDLLGLDLSLYHAFGPLQDRRRRPFRSYLSLLPSLLDPQFRPTHGADFALGAAAGLAWETRVDSTFPREGHRLSLGLGGGLVPGGDRWGNVGANGVALLPLGGRLTLATRLSGALATGDVAHRQLSLGGAEAIQGLPVDALLGHQRLLAAAELRAQPIRAASIPLPLAWGSDLQLSAGLEAGLLAGGDEAQALGGTAGIAGVADLFGARPALLGLWAARPLWAAPAALAANPPTQLYLRMFQAF